MRASRFRCLPFAFCRRYGRVSVLLGTRIPHGSVLRLCTFWVLIQRSAGFRISRVTGVYSKLGLFVCPQETFMGKEYCSHKSSNRPYNTYWTMLKRRCVAVYDVQRRISESRAVQLMRPFIPHTLRSFTRCPCLAPGSE